jgi:hypothetical protein
MTLDQMTPEEIMEMTPAQVDALVWVDDQCENCPLAGQCDIVTHELCSGALRADNVSE